MKHHLAIGTVIAVLLSAPAYAADAVVEVAPVPVITIYDWSGPYIGVFAGVITGDFDYEAGFAPGPVLFSPSDSDTGFVGGGQVGYDFQTGNWVFGAVADIAYTNFSGDVDIGPPGPFGGPGITGESELKYLGTVRARAGYAFDRTLIYAHGGFAYGRAEHTITAPDGATLFDESTTHTGWTIGGGMEYAFTDQVSFGLEYAYVDLGDEEISDGIGGPLFVNEELKFSTVKAMMNYRF